MVKASRNRATAPSQPPFFNGTSKGTPRALQLVGDPSSCDGTGVTDGVLAPRLFQKDRGAGGRLLGAEGVKGGKFGKVVRR